MKKELIKLLSLFSIIAYGAILINDINIKSFSLTIFIFLLFLIFLIKSKKILVYSNKKIIMSYCLYQFIFTIIQLLFINNYLCFGIIPLVINDIIGSLLFIYLAKKKNLEIAILYGLLSIIGIPMLYCGNYNSLFILFIFILIYSCISISYEYPYSKRNIAKYFIICCGFTLLITKWNLFLLLYFLFLLIICKNISKKILLMMFILTISLVLLIQFQINEYNLFNIFSIDEYFYKGLMIDFCYYFVFCQLVVLNIIVVYSIKRYNDLDYKNIIIYQMFLVFLLISDLIYKDNIINVAAVLISIYFSIIMYYIKNKNILCIPYYKRYIKPSSIKKVSVVIPNYNYERFIEKRIDSVLKQTYPIYELIILDDNSNDNSVKVIEEKIKRIKNKNRINIKFIKNKENSGNVFKQWEKAFIESSGDYLWIAEADDLCDKHFLNVVMKGFKNDDVILSFCDSSAINENDKIYKIGMKDWVDIYNTGHFNKDYINEGKEELRHFLCISNTIVNVSGVVFKKDKKIDFGKYLNNAQKYRLAGDWYFYSKVLLHGAVAYSSDPLNYHRLHDNSITSTTDNFVRYKEITDIQKMISTDIKLSTESINKVELYINNLKKNYFITDEEVRYDSVNMDSLLKSKKINDSILLSIIIYNYNSLKLKSCLESFINYLPANTEVIIISDNCEIKKIINDYKNNYEQIKFFCKEYDNVLEVKKYGIKVSNGRYITFLDSNNIVSSNMYSVMLKKAIENNSDIVYSNILRKNESGYFISVNTSNDNYKNEYERILLNYYMPQLGNKIIKRELFKNIIKYNNKYFNDIVLVPLLVLKSKKITKINSYFYRIIDTGVNNNMTDTIDIIKIFDNVILLLEKIKDLNEYFNDCVTASVLTYQTILIMISRISLISNEEKRKKIIYIFCNKFNSIKLDVLKNKYVVEYLNNNSYYSKLFGYICDKNINGIDEVILKDIKEI